MIWPRKWEAFNGLDLIWAIIRPGTWQAINGPDQIWAGIWPKTWQPVNGPAYLGPQNLMGLKLGRPINVGEISWAFSRAGPL